MEMLSRCSRCGACQANCPLYTATGREQFVARGKIELLEMLEEGKIEWNDKLGEIFSTCLLCGRCGENCTNNVKGDELVREARRDLVGNLGLPIIKKTVFQHFLTKTGRLNVLAKLLYLYHALGMDALTRATGILKLLPGDLAAKESLLPPVTRLSSFRESTPSISKANGTAKYRVAYFTGCMTNYMFPATGANIIKMLNESGVEVVIPDQACCGIPALASGDHETARKLAEKNVAAFAKTEADDIIADCASCIGTWHEYPQLLEQSPAAVALSEKVIDIGTLLVKVLDFQPPKPVNVGTVTFHEPCHFRKLKGTTESHKELLRRLGPGTKFVELTANSCCGSAGSFNMSHYKLSQQVAQPKIDFLQKNKIDYLVTGCPACLIQLQHAVRNAGVGTQVVHTMDLVAKAYQ